MAAFFINYALKPSSQAKVKDVYLKEGDEFYTVEYQNRKLQHDMPGSWAANYEVKNIKELREKLQVLKGWKDEDIGTLVVRKYKVKAGQNIPGREGYVGNLTTGQSTKIKQWEFIEWWDKSDFEGKIQQIDIKIIK